MPEVHVKFFMKILEDLMQIEKSCNSNAFLSQLLKDPGFYAAVAVLSLQIVNFMNDGRSDELAVQLQFFACSAVNLWKIVLSYTHCQAASSMKPPAPIRLHLARLESRVSFALVWRGASEMVAYLQERRQFLGRALEGAAGENEDQSFEEYEEEGDEESGERDFSEEPPGSARPKGPGVLLTLLKRLLMLAGDRLHRLCLKLGIAEEVCEAAWSVLKKVVIFEPELLRDRTVDQVIVCSAHLAQAQSGGQLGFGAVLAE